MPALSVLFFFIIKHRLMMVLPFYCRSILEKVTMHKKRAILSFFFVVMIKVPYNARSDWLKQRTLSENRERVNDIKLAFKFLLRNFDSHLPFVYITFSC